MGRYRKIDSRIWNDAKFASLTHEAQRAFLYVLTNPAMTSLGAFRGTLNGMGIELGIDQKDLTEVFGQLFRKGLVKVDERAFLWWCPNFLKYNTPENPNVIKGWVTALEMLPECPLLSEVLTRAVAAAKEKFPNNNSVLEACDSFERVIASLSKELGKELGQPLPQVFRKQEQEQEQEIYTAPLADGSGASVPVADAPSPKRKKKKDDDIQYVDCPEGINPVSWAEWMVIRKKKKLGGLTPYGLELLRQECSKADISLQRAIDHCIESGWGGFKAAYIANLPKEKPDPFRVKNPYIPPGIDPNAKVKPWPKTSPWDDPVYEAEILGAIRKSTGLDGGDSK